jgi:hypothetical protein
MMVEHGSLLQNAVEHETNSCYFFWPITNWDCTTRTLVIDIAPPKP